MQGKLTLSDKTTLEGISYGANTSASGEVVFSTGMVGYPESLTDPSYKGQILVLTYPIIGNYGIPEKSLWESNQIQVSGLIVSEYIDTPSHFQSVQTLAEWFKKENLPLLQIKDTRGLTQKLRQQGTMLGKIEINKTIDYYDPDKDNLVAQVSTKTIEVNSPSPFKGKGRGEGKNNRLKTILLLDCGAKKNITRCFLNRGVRVIKVPWDYDPFSEEGQNHLKDVIARSEATKQSHSGSKKTNAKDHLFDAFFISNGPGNPKRAEKTIQTIKKSLENKIPTLGICLGNQLLALAARGDTYKLKFGHRSQNQPCTLKSTNRCYVTTQNHGYAIGDVPAGFEPWFVNANDKTIEGIIHTKYPFMAVQFHPEANPGPKDTEWIFDYFLERIK